MSQGMARRWASPESVQQHLRGVLPQLEKIGVATAAEVNIDTLEDRLRDAASTVHSQVLGPMQFCGWTKL